MTHKKIAFTNKLLKKWIFFLLLSLVSIFILVPVIFLTYTYYEDRSNSIVFKKGYTNDASHLNESAVTIVSLKQDSAEILLQMANLIKLAKKEGKNISIAGARHSMGGHTITSDGIMIDMSNLNYMQLDTINNTLHVGAGALWSDVIPFLEKSSRSVLVMQSNNSFSIGGSISVNCHGWQVNSPPVSATVNSFRLMDANGTLLQCSRTENKELFSLVLGGFGLFGIIVDVNLNVTDNTMYELKSVSINSSDYTNEYRSFVVDNKDVGMAYGRLNVTRSKFMQEAIITKFIVRKDLPLKALRSGSYKGLRRTVFRSSANSNYGKSLRWSAEKISAKIMSGSLFSRNQLQDEGVEIFENTKPGFTDILHEYFIPKDSLRKFIAEAQKIIPSYDLDLLNITIRDVKKDSTSFLSYARQDVFGLVMLFNQATEDAADIEMQRLTQKLVDLSIRCGGTYYLPYRLHATVEQMHRAYCNATEFFLKKKQYDPTELFQNKFYQKYK